MSIIDFEIKKIGKSELKVEKKEYSWEIILNNKDDFYADIASIILDENSLYYFVSSNNDSRFLQDKLSEKQRKKMRAIFEELINHPENFYSNYQKEKNLVEELDLVINDRSLKLFADKYGMKISKNATSFAQRKSYIKSSIKKESLYGIFGEILLYIVVEKLMFDKKIIISKLNFITAPSTYAHGSDGIFIDDVNKKLYFGEAKFTIDLSSALEQALLSMKDIEERIKVDENFLLIHETSFKNGYNIEIFDDDKIQEFDKCIIIFALHGTEYDDKDLKTIFNDFYDKFNQKLANISFEIISFPILSKDELKEEIAKQVAKKYEDNR